MEKWDKEDFDDEKSSNSNQQQRLESWKKAGQAVRKLLSSVSLNQQQNQRKGLDSNSTDAMNEMLQQHGESFASREFTSRNVDCSLDCEVCWNEDRIPTPPNLQLPRDPFGTHDNGKENPIDKTNIQKLPKNVSVFHDSECLKENHLCQDFDENGEHVPCPRYFSELSKADVMNNLPVSVKSNKKEKSLNHVYNLCRKTPLGKLNRDSITFGRTLVDEVDCLSETGHKFLGSVKPNSSKNIETSQNSVELTSNEISQNPRECEEVFKLQDDETKTRWSLLKEKIKKLTGRSPGESITAEQRLNENTNTADTEDGVLKSSLHNMFLNEPKNRDKQRHRASHFASIDSDSSASEDACTHRYSYVRKKTKKIRKASLNKQKASCVPTHHVIPEEQCKLCGQSHSSYTSDYLQDWSVMDSSSQICQCASLTNGKSYQNPAELVDCDTRTTLLSSQKPKSETVNSFSEFVAGTFGNCDDKDKDSKFVAQTTSCHLAKSEGQMLEYPKELSLSHILHQNHTSGDEETESVHVNKYKSHSTMLRPRCNNSSLYNSSPLKQLHNVKASVEKLLSLNESIDSSRPQPEKVGLNALICEDDLRCSISLDSDEASKDKSHVTRKVQDISPVPLENRAENAKQSNIDLVYNRSEVNNGLQTGSIQGSKEGVAVNSKEERVDVQDKKQALSNKENVHNNVLDPKKNEHMLLMQERIDCLAANSKVAEQDTDDIKMLGTSLKNVGELSNSLEKTAGISVKKDELISVRHLEDNHPPGITCSYDDHLCNDVLNSETEGFKKTNDAGVDCTEAPRTDDMTQSVVDKYISEESSDQTRLLYQLQNKVTDLLQCNALRIGRLQTELEERSRIPSSHGDAGQSVRQRDEIQQPRAQYWGLTKVNRRERNMQQTDMKYMSSDCYGSSSGEETDEEDNTLQDGLPTLVSSSEEDEKPVNPCLTPVNKSPSSIQAEVMESPDSLLISYDSDLGEGLCDLDIQAGTEEDEPKVLISPREIDSLPELVSSSNNSPYGSEADDEFECDCIVCLSGKPHLNNNSSTAVKEDTEERIASGSEDKDELNRSQENLVEYLPPEEYFDPEPDLFNDESVGHLAGDLSDDLFTSSLEWELPLSVHDLSPLDLLVTQEGTWDVLAFMFQNVIRQMLSVYPDLLSDRAPPPLTPDIISTIPVISVDQDTIAQDARCPICLCEFEVGEEARQLKCHHTFHILCIAAWLAKSATCPVCRDVVRPDSYQLA